MGAFIMIPNNIQRLWVPAHRREGAKAWKIDFAQSVRIETRALGPEFQRVISFHMGAHRQGTRWGAVCSEEGVWHLSGCPGATGEGNTGHGKALAQQVSLGLVPYCTSGSLGSGPGKPAEPPHKPRVDGGTSEPWRLLSAEWGPPSSTLRCARPGVWARSGQDSALTH